MTAEIVYREEVEKEVEYLGEGARNIANFYHRAKEQGAPMELLNEMSMVWQSLEDARRRLESLLPCFKME